jgi:hypothetical protein
MTTTLVINRDTEVFIPIWEGRRDWLVLQTQVPSASELLIIETNKNLYLKQEVTPSKLFSGRFILASIEEVYSGTFYLDWFSKLKGSCALKFKPLFCIDQYSFSTSKSATSFCSKHSSNSVSLDESKFENLIQNYCLHLNSSISLNELLL